jgi:hypothetical protein
MHDAAGKSGLSLAFLAQVAGATEKISKVTCSSSKERLAGISII